MENYRWALARLASRLADLRNRSCSQSLGAPPQGASLACCDSRRGRRGLASAPAVPAVPASAPAPALTWAWALALAAAAAGCPRLRLRRRQLLKLLLAAATQSCLRGVWLPPRPAPQGTGTWVGARGNRGTGRETSHTKQTQSLQRVPFYPSPSIMPPYDHRTASRYE